MSMHKRFRLAALVVGYSLVAGMASAQARDAVPMQTIEGLGTVSFPTSTRSVAAQTAFVRGLLLLHLFEYPDAANAFRDAEKLDPDFAMAYWGEAMTFNHGIWNQLDADAGRAALAKLAATPSLRMAKTPTQREKDYLAAVEILYAADGSKQQRDARYDEAMARLAAAYPRDNNAQLFHALAMMGRSEGVRDVPAYLRAGAIAEHAYQVNPKNPGAAHYWIHAMDDPAHAANALEPARALSNIAPDAGHAQHMTSHIFMALGMWDDVTSANEIAMRVLNRQAKAKGRPLIGCGHYSEWLEYAYFQQGRRRDATKTFDACRQSLGPALKWANSHAQELAARHGTPATYMQDLNEGLVQMRATAVVESHDGNGAAAVTTVDTSGMGADAAWDAFASGYAALERNDLVAAQTALTKLTALRAASKAVDSQTSSYLTILEDDLGGLLAIRQGKPDAGLESIRRAASRYDAMSFDFGPPVPVKPPQELLGEQLLKRDDASAARAAFQASLKSAPRRTLSLLGLARAQSATGDTAAATKTYQELIAIWHGADADLPELAEAREFVSTHP